MLCESAWVRLYTARCQVLRKSLWPELLTKRDIIFHVSRHVSRRRRIFMLYAWWHARGHTCFVLKCKMYYSTYAFIRIQCMWTYMLCITMHVDIHALYYNACWLFDHRICRDMSRYVATYVGTDTRYLETCLERKCAITQYVLVHVRKYIRCIKLPSWTNTLYVLPYMRQYTTCIFIHWLHLIQVGDVVHQNNAMYKDTVCMLQYAGCPCVMVKNTPKVLPYVMEMPTLY
jgi:hypothetical protein